MIRIALFFSFFLLIVARPAFSGPGEDLFTQAVLKYQSGDYSAAITLNERVLNEEGLESAELYFNLGNSYFRAGDLGHAVLNYMRAQRLSPRDGDIKANLAFARQAIEQIEPEKTASSPDRWFAVFSSLSTSEFKWLALCALMLTGALCLGCLYAGLPSKRVTLFTGLSLLVTGYIFFAFAAHYLTRSGSAVVLTRTEARFEPSTQATVYFKLPEGVQVKILRHNEGWAKVQRLDGRLGWVPDNSVGAI